MSKKNKNSKSKQDSKIAVADFLPSSERNPRIAIENQKCIPEFRTDQMDMEGEWGWSKFNIIHLKEFLTKIFESQKLNWQTLYQKKSHLVDIVKLVPNAQKRLQKIGKDDIDQLYSLRISGKKRIWGIKEGNLFWLLWWDPEHEVCESIGADN